VIMLIHQWPWRCQLRHRFISKPAESSSYRFK